ncbi:DUF2225 domain-containing protein [Clostridium botulinum]|uniref:DUF2225 domain-containing protein n=1 Tax=Clostridium botulinum TaxID=1491 RepID=A0A9Q1V0X3_CLOBO|nr:DUF2225 domain-containing protein [Clostridium botulinum]AEB75213.1 conserved protein [Clostridium botulinum BKT015925]KEI03330.1 hypothetical protein Z953_05045 [Clostridium botulinum D str. 16868]KEI05406.1 hypothetical protein Y848_08945 [Clostridium botulinum C/D str. Sp77]KLU75187.1 hypothetical protein CBC3_10050 [Clostridium botulinum V891]KOA73358.1 hypothetical protein ADU78_12755 [Clostridium botulinum]
MKNLFAGLDKLGFEDIKDVELYGNDNELAPEKLEDNITPKEISHLYDKKIICPVCENEFTVKAIKTSSYKMKSRDSDFFIRYDLINPYFYDVWICNDCGYSAMKSDFLRIRSYQKDDITNNISSRWKGREYPIPYNVDTAIERYKLSLLNYFYMDARYSQKAMNCLKLAWMYRLKDDKENEQLYLIESLKGFKEAYLNEDFPIYGMKKFTVMYLIGELNRLTNNTKDALLWLGNVITSPMADRKIKDLARDQRDLLKSPENIPDDSSSSSSQSVPKKKGFFSSLFDK